MRIGVIGGSAAGMFAALVLATAGHELVLLEQDSFDPACELEAAAASAFRTGAPQVVQPHSLIPLTRLLLLQHLPDVYRELRNAGVLEASIESQMPPTLVDRAPLPGDDQIAMMQTRRSTMDWVLRRAVAAQPGVEVRPETQVTGIVAAPGDIPHVTGVRTADGEIRADLVIDTSGYRSPVERWLAELGARKPHVQRVECGIAYFSRFYRRTSGQGAPGLPTTRVLANFDEFTVGIWAADNRAMQIAVAPLASDARFKTLRNPDVFTGFLRTIPYFAAWLQVLEPLTPVYPMGSVQNSLRRLVVDGEPLVTGFVGLGDSVCTTNPTLGRGLALALSGAVRLRDAIAQYGDRPHDMVLTYDQTIAREIAPFYEDQARVDGARCAMLRNRIFGEPAPAPPPADSQRLTFLELRNAAMFDPVVYRAFWKYFGMLDKPENIYRDPEIVQRARAVLRENPPQSAIAPPRREDWLSALGATREWAVS